MICFLRKYFLSTLIHIFAIYWQFFFYILFYCFRFESTICRGIFYYIRKYILNCRLSYNGFPGFQFYICWNITENKALFINFFKIVFFFWIEVHFRRTWKQNKWYRFKFKTLKKYFLKSLNFLEITIWIGMHGNI